MAESKSIDLLPEITETEVKEVQKKGKVNVFGVFAILVVVAVSLIILGVNLYFLLRKNSQEQALANSVTEIQNLQYVELKQKTLNNKVGVYKAVSERDFSADAVLTYLMEVGGDLSHIETLYLDDQMNFELRGSADSYMNVARLWHEMSSQQEYFENVDLDYVRQDTDEENERVVFGFSGMMSKESASGL